MRANVGVVIPRSEPQSKGFWDWLDERLGLPALQYSAPSYANKIWYALGGITMVSFVLLAVTGIFLAQFYNPDPSSARDSVAYLMNQVPFGAFVRSVHFWLANVMIITLVLHLLRVIWSASYKKPRELNFVIGVGLLVLTAAAFFTGTVLKWDQEGVEAVGHVVGVARLLGNLGTLATPGLTASVPFLTRIYALHIFVAPGLLLLSLGLHLLLVKRHGISPLPERSGVKGHESARRVEALPSSTFSMHLRKLAGFGMFLAAIVAVLALVLPARLGPPGISGIEVTRPPLEFLWLTNFENWFGLRSLLWVPAILASALIALPFIDRSKKLHMIDRKWVLVVTVLLIAAWIGLTIYAGKAPEGNHLGM